MEKSKKDSLKVQIRVEKEEARKVLKIRILRMIMSLVSTIEIV